MTEDTGYQGWTNYATWGAALILNNDRGTYEEMHGQLSEIARLAPEDDNVLEKIWTTADTIRYRFGDWLKDYIEELCMPKDEPEHAPTQMASQLLRAALDDVNYDEIASNIISETSEVSSA